MYHLFFYLILKVVKKHKMFGWESGVRYNLSGSVYVFAVLLYTSLMPLPSAQTKYILSQKKEYCLWQKLFVWDKIF